MIEQAIIELDIPAFLRERAVAEYESVGQFLDDFFLTSGRSGCEVYSQGSFRLGTVIRPIGRGDFDVDLVCCRNLAPSSTSKEELKREVGEGLKAFLDQREKSGLPTLESGNRCWTLGYADQFHMDALPSIPAPDGPDNAIWLTDRNYQRWLHSNPIDYASWFKDRMAAEFQQLRVEAAQRVEARVEDIPESEITTTLQRAVQFMKRHRDVYFDNLGQSELRPPSILITTLAARAYSGGGELFDVAQGIAGRMGSFVINKDGERWVVNPVEPDENFADKWVSNPDLEPAFWRWLRQLVDDLNELAIGPDDPYGAATVNRLARLLGAEVVAKAVGLPSSTAKIGEFSSSSGDPGEMFIGERFEVDVSDAVRVVCRVGRKPGFRDGLLHTMGYRVQVGRSLTFRVVDCTVEEPYDVYWKIKNTGSEALAANALRGEIVRGGSGRTHHESTLYRGEHFVECYVVKDDIVRAQARHRVVIV